ncbi:winged helix-turn-helix domain-containing protein [Streptomyces sp. NPDC015032]|uniref:winged helix-turn-helix domain-containing protein n=1 Tax=Streptomyces sp. NPDC015032 TaxID=3364937 RepID=UPI0036F7FDD1
MFENSNHDVKFVRWPAQASQRSYCNQQGIPCLLVVEGGATPPICSDPFEDWVRAPISRPDLDARVTVLRLRAYGRKTPVLDATGTLRFDTRSVSISTAQIALMELLVAHFGEVVHRDELRERLAERAPSSPTRNSLDLHIMRLRRRLTPVKLVIRTVWGRGYSLEPQSEANIAQKACS